MDTILYLVVRKPSQFNNTFPSYPFKNGSFSSRSGYQITLFFVNEKRKLILDITNNMDFSSNRYDIKQGR